MSLILDGELRDDARTAAIGDALDPFQAAIAGEAPNLATPGSLDAGAWVLLVADGEPFGLRQAINVRVARHRAGGTVLKYFAYSRNELEAPSATVDRRANDQLVAELSSEDPDRVTEAAAAIQRRLRSGGADLAAHLRRIALGDHQGADATFRCIALETMAGARAPAHEPHVVELIREFVASDDEDVVLSAIAAAGFLSREGKASIRSMVHERGTRGSARLRRAMDAFLREIR